MAGIYIYQPFGALRAPLAGPAGPLHYCAAPPVVLALLGGVVVDVYRQTLENIVLVGCVL